jgi:hypothetical protein
VDISGIGRPVVIDPPNGELAAVTEGPSPQEVQAAGIATPVELARMPETWSLAGIELRDDDHRPGCRVLELFYGTSDSILDEYLTLRVMAPRCARLPAPDAPEAGPVLRAGAFTGSLQLGFDEGGGVLTDGRTAIEYISDLPTDDVLRLLETLEPYDPATRPTAIGAAS